MIESVGMRIVLGDALGYILLQWGSSSQEIFIMHSNAENLCDVV